jgi:hypothetical protein
LFLAFTAKILSVLAVWLAGPMGRPKQSHDPNDTTILYVRGIPLGLSRKVRATAALAGEGVPGYVIGLLQKHVEELQRKGILPKVKE